MDDGINRGVVSSEPVDVAGEEPFRTVFLTEDDPFLYSPVLAAAMTGWALMASPCFMPMLIRYLDRRFRRKLGVAKTKAHREAEELQRRHEEIQAQLAKEAEIDGAHGGPVVRKKRKRSVWVAPEQRVADGAKRYTAFSRAGAPLLLSKKAQAIKQKELGFTTTGHQAARMVPQKGDKLGEVLGFTEKIAVLKKPVAPPAHAEER